MTPTITFCIPTLNAAKVLTPCLKSIMSQNYKRFKIIIADGGSTDNTINIAKKFKAKVVKNPLKTAEAGKAIAVRQANTEYICLLDSDNILPDKNWLKKMLLPFPDPSIVGTEPWAFTYRKQAGFVERYSALIGANDPYAFIVGVSDRINYINHHWTSLPLHQTDQGKYLKVTLKPNQTIPTIGANGTIFKTNFIKDNLKSDYLFDIDLIQQVINQTQKPLYFAKVKTGIIHTYCESSVKKFIRKQNRRLIDYYQYQDQRQYNWSQTHRFGIIKFVFHTIFISPFLSIIGFLKKPDLAWFFHPLACCLSLFVYSSVTIKHQLNLQKPVSRQTWRQ